MPQKTQKQKVIDDMYMDAFERSCKLPSSDYAGAKKIEDELQWNVLQVMQIVRSIPKQTSWVNDVLPNFDEDRFKSVTRVTFSQFQMVMDLIEKDPTFHDKKNLQLPVGVQLAVTLFRIGHEGFGLRYIATLFGLGDGSTVTRITRRVIKAVNKHEKQVIYWPDVNERRGLEVEELPGCIAFMDGTNIELDEAPVMDYESYFDKKKNYSVKVNLICDKYKRIRHFRGAYPGSVHDSRLWNDSNISQDPCSYLNIGQFIAADKAYTLTEHVIVPFRDNSPELDGKKRRAFNRHFSKHRVVIEHVNGVLKETFESLKDLKIRIHNKETHEEATNWIKCCLILYNLITPFDNFEPETVHQNGNNVEEELAERMVDDEQAGTRRRIELWNWIEQNM